MGYIELCGFVHTAQRQTSTQIPIRFCVNLSVYVSVLVSASVSLSGSVNAPLQPHILSIKLIQECIPVGYAPSATVAAGKGSARGMSVSAQRGEVLPRGVSARGSLPQCMLGYTLPSPVDRILDTLL